MAKSTARNRRWVGVEVNLDNVGPGDIPYPEAVEDAAKLARIIRLRPETWSLDRDGAGRFSLSGHDLEDSVVFGEMPSDDDGLGKRYRFEAIRNAARAEAVAAALRRRAKRDEWSIEAWLEYAVKRRSPAVAVYAPGDRVPAGFVCYERHVDAWPDYGGKVGLLYQMRARSVYIVPNRRGMRLSSALRRVIMEDVFDDVDRLRKTFTKRNLGDLSRGIIVIPEVSADTYSEEGERFAYALAEAMGSAFELGFFGYRDAGVEIEGVSHNYG